MKHIVNVIQLAIVAAIIFPMYYVWDSGKVDNICEEIHPGLAKHVLLEMVDERGIKMDGPHDEDIAGGKWHATIMARTPLVEHSCTIKGVGNTVAIAKLN